MPVAIIQPEIITGPGCLDRLGELAEPFGVGPALIVTDEHIIEAGHLCRATDSLDRAGVTWSVFGGVIENPTTDCVQRCAEAAEEVQPAWIIGLGGGSAIDTAKGCNLIHTNGGTMHDYLGHHETARPMLPLVAVPTTAGTGSEAQSYALISDAATGRKMACGAAEAMPAVALLDPLLTLTQPRPVAACSGIDALAHAIESAVCTRRNEESFRYSRTALRLLIGHLETVLEGGDEVEARAAVQLGAAYAGMAIERSMLGAAHALANPLTARYGIAHGQAVGRMLPYVIRYNAEHTATRAVYDELAAAVDLSDGQALIERVEALLVLSELDAGLQTMGVTVDAIDGLAEQAAEQWTGRFNPRPVDARALGGLYRRAYHG